MKVAANRPSEKVSDFEVNKPSHTPIFYPARELRKVDLAKTDPYAGKSLGLVISFKLGEAGQNGIVSLKKN